MICFTMIGLVVSRSLSKDFVFFFSSRRRHTRLVSDWSSDVCSSDLGELRRAFWREIRATSEINYRCIDDSTTHLFLRTLKSPSGARRANIMGALAWWVGVGSTVFAGQSEEDCMYSLSPSILDP